MNRPKLLYAESHRWSFIEILSPVMVVAVIVLAFVNDRPWSLPIGGALAIYVWIITPFNYKVFNDSFVITYGMPRRSVVFFKDIQKFGLVRLPIGDRIMVERKKGRRLLLKPRNPEVFQSKLAEAFEENRRLNPEQPTNT